MAVIEDGNAEDTNIALSALGEYILELVASDGEYTGSDTVTINVYNDSCEAAKSLCFRSPENAALGTATLLLGLKDVDPAVRIQAAGALGNLANKIADRAAVLTALEAIERNDPEERVRLTARTSIGLLRGTTKR